MFGYALEQPLEPTLALLRLVRDTLFKGAWARGLTSALWLAARLCQGLGLAWWSNWLSHLTSERQLIPSRTLLRLLRV